MEAGVSKLLVLSEPLHESAARRPYDAYPPEENEEYENPSEYIEKL